MYINEHIYVNVEFTTDFNDEHMQDGGNSGVANVPNINIHYFDMKSINFNGDQYAKNNWLQILSEIKSKEYTTGSREKAINECTDVLNVLRTIYYDNLLLNVGAFTDDLEFILLCSKHDYTGYEGRYTQPRISVNNTKHRICNYTPSYTREYRYGCETEQLISKLQNLSESN